MKRRTLLLSSSAALSAILAGCSSDETASASSSISEDDVALEVAYNYRAYDRLTTPDNEDVYESDNETQYVGVQVEVTNVTDDELSVSKDAFSVRADGTTDGVTIHGQSNTEPLESISAGETVSTWLFFTAPPEADYDFATTEAAEHTVELTHDETLEIALEEYEE